MLFINVVLPVFLLALAGFLLERKSELDLRTLTNTSLYLFCPALVYSALMRRSFAMLLLGHLTLFMVLYTLAMCLIAYGASRLGRFNNETARALTLTTAMMNVGNFGLPLVYFAYGEQALDVSIMTFVLFNIPLGTLAIVIAQGQGVKLREAMANALRIPIFHSVVLALVCKAANWQPPDFILRPVELLGQAAIPMMLVMLGMQLARSKVRDAWGFFAAATAIRLLIAPLVAIALLAAIGIGGLSRNVVVLQTSTPAAVLPLLYALRFNTRPDLVSGTILTSTLCSAVTLTLLLYWL